MGHGVKLVAALGVLAAAATGAVVATPAPAHAYGAGSASGYVLGYDTTVWGKRFRCAYAGWDYPAKDWYCSLKDPTFGETLDEDDGTFTGSGFTTRDYIYLTNDQYLCSFGEATYQDGSSGASGERCG